MYFSCLCFVIETADSYISAIFSAFTSRFVPPNLSEEFLCFGASSPKNKFKICFSCAINLLRLHGNQGKQHTSSIRDSSSSLLLLLLLHGLGLLRHLLPLPLSQQDAQLRQPLLHLGNP